MSNKRRSIPLFLLAGLLFGVKTYIVYRFLFHIELDNMLQEFILVVNPFVASIIFFGISVWFKNPKKQRRFIRYSALIGTLIIYFNLIFYRSFTDFLTIPQLLQTSNVTDLTSSIVTLIKPYDLLLFIDLIIIWMICKRANTTIDREYTKRNKVLIAIISFALLAGNFLLAEMERPQLLSRGFDREYLVKNIGLFYYHIYDIVSQSKMRSQKALANDHDLKTIKQYINDEIRSDTKSDYFGIGEGRNVIFISAESIQSFVIDDVLYGKEITPFLNELKEDNATFYFDNFYHQTSQGKTSDSEFLTENSLYPLSSGAVFFTHAQNKYHSMTEMVKEKGYTSAVFHANTDSFWNRNQMYEQFKVDTFYDSDSYHITDENQVGWGLKDKEFFSQSIPLLKDLETPYYAKLITITNHFPFDLDEADRTLEPYDSNSNTLNKYFSTVRYTDEALEEFFMQLKASGLYENSIIVIMGDHDGISANHNKAMAQFLEQEEITPYDYMQLQRVPFYIHIPGIDDGKTMSKIAGQVDIKPTLLHLLGIETNQDIYFGNDLFHEDRKGLIVQRNGNFISEDYIYTQETCYDRETGEVIEENSDSMENETLCEDTKEIVEKELKYSDKIIYGDLFRFIDFESH